MLIFLLLFAVESKSQSLYHTFTTNDNFVVPAGITKVTVEAWGGGGGGGINGNNGAGGGGGGAYAKREVTVIPGNSYAIIVGKGGAEGMPGGNSSFATNVVVAAGGNNGNGTTGGVGGLNTNCIGTVRYSGGNGGEGNSDSGGGGGSSAATSANGSAGTDASGNTGGAGGGTFLSSLIGGNGGAGGDSGNPGIVGMAPGGGGGGKGDGVTASGKGGDGQVIVTWDCPATAGTLSGATNICYNGTTTLSSDVPGGTWSSSNPTYAVIDPTAGLVTAKVAGAGKTVTMTYTVASVGCPSRTESLIITIDDLLTIDPASSSPTPCINTLMTSITHATTGATGIGTATGLPAGVTVSWASNTITISGTPTESGTFNYSIPVTATCGGSNAIGTIIVEPNNTVSAASSSQTPCVNTLMTSIIHTTTGATGIGTATGLPAGVTASWASNTITISGTPTASGTFNYSIPLTGGCGNVSATGTITVRPNNTVSAASSSPTLCINTLMSNITHTTTGATGIGAATGLPSGVTASWASNTLTISGTPTASGTFNYSIPLTGGCGNVSATGTITVRPNNTVSAASSSPTPCINTLMTSITHTTTGATGIGAATGLPAGITASWASNTLTISGTPTASGTFNYSIPLTGGCGNVSATGIITVYPTPNVIATPASQTICSGETTSIALSSGVSGTTYNWTVVQSGVTGATAGSGNNIVHTLTASGTAPGTATYTITPRANGCNGNPITVVISVNPTPTVNPPGNQIFCQGVVTTPIALSGAPSGVVFDITGGTGIGLSNQTGVSSIPAFTPIAGTATITLTPRANGCTGSSLDFFITVNAIPTLSGATQPIPVCAGSAAVINLTGLRPTTTSTIAYSINGVAQTPVNNIISDNTGKGSFTTPALTAANNGQILRITRITITSNPSNCNQDFSRDVTLSVNTAPVFTSCPASINLNTSAGACTATGAYNVVASGQPSPTYNYTFTGATTGSGTGTGSGATFNAGTTHVKVTATNTCGSVDCSFDIVVSDNVVPVISGCPANITVNTGAGRTSCDQTASWTEPTATDNCTPSGSLAWTKTHTPGSTFPVGTTTVTYTARDANNNPVSCIFTVTVIDNTKPTFNAPADITIDVSSTCTVNSSSSVTGSVTGLFDNCTPSANLDVTYSDGSSTAAAAGCNYPYSFVRTWRVTDGAGNMEEKVQTITVRDLVKPIITIPADIALSCEQSTLPAVSGTATATDNCSPTVAITYTDVVTAGNCSGNKVIARTWTATDCSGNVSTGKQIITINDITKPVGTIPVKYATCASTIPLAYANYAEFIAAGGTASDNCGSVTVTLYDEISNGLEGKPGYCPTSLTRIYRLTDECGNYTDVNQTINIGSECPCTYCTDGTEFYMVDLLGQPDGQVTFYNVDRNGKCCADDEWWKQPGAKNMECVSFNIRIDDDAVGVEIYFESGAKPSNKDWRQDCEAIDVSSGIVCLSPGTFHLFTYCKQGGNDNQITIKSIKGAVSSSDLNTRVDCSETLHVTGINAPQWTSVSPGVRGQYDSYLDVTDPFNPVFNAPVNSPSIIQYEVCGTFGSLYCGKNTISTDCDIVTINVKPEIALEWNNDPQVICEGHIPVMVANISPSNANYTYVWYSGHGATGTPIYSGSASYQPTAEGPYSIRVTDIQEGISCNSQVFDFDIAYDKTGPSLIAPPQPLTVECNDPMASQQINNWLASATATYTDATGNTVNIQPTTDYTGINMACGTVQTVTFTVADQCTNTTTTTSTITVRDTQAPVWSSMAGALNRTISCSDNAALAAAQALAPTATDLCDPGLTLTKTSGAFVAGSCPHSGTYTNTWVARDDCNNVSSVYTQVITVIDDTPPVFSTQAQPITVECDGSGNTGEYNAWIANHGGAIAADDCGGLVTWTASSPVYTTICGKSKTATVTFTATDVCGNSAITQAVFTIADTQGPVIVSCPAPATGTTNTNECYSTNVILGTPTATDNCSEPVTFTNNAPAQFPAGVTTVTWTATDACGNQTTCTQTVTVTDNNQPPTIQCFGDVEDLITTNNCSKIGVVITPPTIADNCPNPVLSWEMTGATIATGLGAITTSQVFNVGKTIVTYTVTDIGGHTATCSFQVWIKNLAAPKFKATCSPNSSVTAIAPLNECQVNVPIETPTIYNPCNEYYTITNNSPYKTSDLNAGGLYPVGVTNFTWTITDASGNITTCTQTVTVNDTQAPTIACQGNVEDLILDGGCTLVSSKLTDPVITDNCPAPVLTYHLVFENGTTADGNGSVTNYAFPVGKTQVTYTVTDVGGRTATCLFQVWIKNIANPHFKVACRTGADKDLFVDAEVDKCDASVTFKAPEIDNYCEEVFGVTYQIDANPAVPVAVTGSSIPDITQRFAVGNHTISWVIISASGTPYSCTQTVTVNDTQAPTITCQGDVEDLIVDEGCTLVSSKLTDPVIKDNCPGSVLTYHLVFENGTTADGNGPVTNYAFPIGKTQVTYTVTDAAVPSHTTSCSFQVWIKNIDSPNFKVTCPTGTDKDIIVAADANQCDKSVTFKAPEIYNYCEEVFSINYQIDSNPAVMVPVVVGSPISPITYQFPIGNHTVLWVITSASGIPYTCTQTVTVNDLPLTCPASFTVPADFGLTHASNVAVPAPGFSNNCSVLTLTWSMLKPDGTSINSLATGINIVASPATFELGTTTIAYTLTHATGVKESCSFTVTVTSKPSITCLTDITHEADLGDCNYTVNPGTPTLEEGAQPITWKWEIKGPDSSIQATGTLVGSTSNPGPPSIGAYDFKVGVSTVTWTATNFSGEDVCIQTVTVTDTQKPDFSLPAPLSECVESLNSASYDEVKMDILPDRPDYYVFIKGSNQSLDLDPASFTDNCLSTCTPVIRWQITMADGSKIPATDPYFTGQPSTYTNNILFPGDGITYKNVIHTITYWIVDCNGQVSDPKTQDITIKPRPNIIKVTN